MKKKLIAIVSIVLTLALVVGCVAVFAGCGNNNNTEKKEIELPAFEGIKAQTVTGTIPADFKIGLICLHDKSSTYDKNFIDAMMEVKAALNLSDDQVKIATGVAETIDCYNKAIELVNQGCKIIIADSFDHESFMMQAAREHSDVLFAHATGVHAHTASLPNFVNAFASIYEGRYLAGVVAGLKLQEMINDGKVKSEGVKVGYVGAHPYAEVISGYTSWFLGVRSVVSNVTMDVTFTGSWYDPDAEYNAAKKLINGGCALISQHADSMGAPNACEEAGVPNVSYNGSTYANCPETFLVSSRINWAPYYTYLIDCVVNKKTPAVDYTGTLATGSVELTNLGSAVAAGTVEKVVAVRKQLANGTLKVFDTSKFTVDGKAVTEYLADVDGDYVPETQVIKNGEFPESSLRSAPYFDANIDGITNLDAKK